MAKCLWGELSGKDDLSSPSSFFSFLVLLRSSVGIDHKSNSDGGKKSTIKKGWGDGSDQSEGRDTTLVNSEFPSNTQFGGLGS